MQQVDTRPTQLPRNIVQELLHFDAVVAQGIAARWQMRSHEARGQLVKELLARIRIAAVTASERRGDHVLCVFGSVYQGVDDGEEARNVCWGERLAVFVAFGPVVHRGEAYSLWKLARKRVEGGGKEGGYVEALCEVYCGDGVAMGDLEGRM